ADRRRGNSRVHARSPLGRGFGHADAGQARRERRVGRSGRRRVVGQGELTAVAAPDTADVVLIGGGVMGCASALALAGEGLRVLVLEKSVPGAEASSAAAGILGAQTEVHEPGPLFDLARLSRARYASWVERLRAATGIDVGYRASGVLRVAFDDEGKKKITEEVAWQTSAGLDVETLDAAGIARLEPSISAM